MPNRRQRRGNRRTLIPINPIPYPRYSPYNFSTAPPRDFSFVPQYDFSSASSTSRVHFPVVPQHNPVSPMPPTLPSVVPSTARTVQSTRNGLRIQFSTSPNEPPTAESSVDDDVVYLYSVSSGRLVEFVDLAEDAETRESNPSSTRNLILANEETSLPENTSNTNTSLLSQLQERDIDVICVSDNTKDLTGKPEVKSAVTKKRKRGSSGEARCIICDMNYERITNGGGELYSSRCGHLFCMACVKNLDPYKCTECDSKISNLWKIYL